MSLYDDLGVARDATPEELNAAFRRRAKEHHPDAGGDAEAFARASHAIAVLRDPAARAEYDATGREDSSSPPGPEEAAREVMLAEFQQVLGQFVEGHIAPQTDLMVVLRGTLARKAGDQRREIAKVEAIQVRARDALDRLRHKGDGPDVVRAMLEGKIVEADRIVADMNRLEAAFVRAGEMALAWDWRADEAPQMDAWDIGAWRGLHRTAYATYPSAPFADTGGAL